MSEDKKIKICYTSEHACIRKIKISQALKRTGKYKICGVANQLSYGTQFFDSFHFYHNKKQFDNTIREIDADVYIHANEPSDQLNWIRAVRPDAKIILDAHDMDSIRIGAIPLGEMRAISNCDAIIFVSRETQEFIKKLHGSQLNGKPTITLGHYVNKEFIQDGLPADQRRGLVYQGGAQSPPYKTPHYRYRHLYNLMRQLVEQGHELHLAFGNLDATIAYSNIGAHCYKAQVYPDLMKFLLTKKWGLVTFNNKNHDQPQVELTLTNKHFEYLACGLPVIVFGATATANWIKKHDVGIVFDNLEDITPEILETEYPRLKKNVDELKPTLTMEKHIGVVDDLIQNLLESK